MRRPARVPRTVGIATHGDRGSRRSSAPAPRCGARRHARQAETEFRSACQTEAEDAARSLSEIEQTWRVEETRCEHSRKLLTQHSHRRARLLDERSALAHPDGQALAALGNGIASMDTEIGADQDGEARAHGAGRFPRPRGAGARGRRRGRERPTQALAKTSARLNALEQLQSRVANSQRLGEWLTRHGMDALTRLWQRIDIEEGWEDSSSESVLRARG